MTNSDRRYAIIRFVQDHYDSLNNRIVFKRGTYLKGHILSVNGVDVNFNPCDMSLRQRSIGTPWRPWTTMPTSSHARAWVEASALEQLAMEAE